MRVAPRRQHERRRNREIAVLHHGAAARAPHAPARPSRRRAARGASDAKLDRGRRQRCERRFGYCDGAEAIPRSGDVPVSSAMSASASRRIPSRSTENASRSVRPAGARSSVARPRRAGASDCTVPGIQRLRQTRGKAQRAALGHGQQQRRVRAREPPCCRPCALRQASPRYRVPPKSCASSMPGVMLRQRAREDRESGPGRPAGPVRRGRAGEARQAAGVDRQQLQAPAVRDPGLAARPHASTSSSARATRAPDPASSSGSRRRRWLSAIGATRAQMVARHLARALDRRPARGRRAAASARRAARRTQARGRARRSHCSVGSGRLQP